MSYLRYPIKTICIDDSNKPNEIKQCNWVVKEKEYTIIRTIRMAISNEIAFELAEISTQCPEYPYYKSTRFGIIEDDLWKLEEFETEPKVEEYEMCNSL